MVGANRVALWPFRGFRNSRPRHEVGLDEFCGPSHDWLISKGRLYRRPGSSILGDTVSGGTGILESKWGAKARRIISALLRSMSDGYPTPTVLYTDETGYEGTLAFRSTNGTDSWRTVGKEFSATHYPAATVPNHRVVPMLYENEYGGVTLHRLNTAEYRAHFAAGSRNVAQFGGDLYLPNYTSTPCRWNGGFNDSTSSGSEACEVFPWGLIPPLALPTAVKGTDLGASEVGPWLGSDAFFYTVCGETFDGQLSMFALPRPENSAWDGYPGYGYIHLDSSNPTHYFASVELTNIPVLPPYFRYVWILRSNKVNVSSSDTTNNFPAIETLQVCGRVLNGVTTYSDTNGNDLSLSPDQRLQDMWERGLQWPPRARNVGSFDGHATLSCLRPNPSAIVIAPWLAGLQNAKIDSETLYSGWQYFVAVTPDHLVLRIVMSGVASDTAMDLSGETLRSLVDKVNTTYTVASVTHTCSYSPLVGKNLTCAETPLTDVSIGMYAIHAKIPAGTRVEYVDDANNHIRLDRVPTAAFSASSVTFTTYTASTGGATGNFAAQVVPGADADADAENLLRTCVAESASWTGGELTLTLTAAANAKYISPGMWVSDVASSWPAGTIVTEVVASTGVVTLSAASTRDGAVETVTFGYDTGDTTLAQSLGYVRAFGNAFPYVLFFSKAYTDGFDASKQTSTFSAASPGYSQDAANTWMEDNRRGGPAEFGVHMGTADVGPAQLEFYARGRMLLANFRTGTTHVDGDYTKQVVSWMRGARSPYAICSGNRWAIFLSDDGLFVCDAQGNEALLSKAIYDPEGRAGERGELEYAVGACVAASEGDTDAYKLHAQVLGSVLYVQYWASSSSTRPDREIRYDFSESVGRSGIGEVLQVNGQPYGWSTPLYIGPSCSALVGTSSGMVRYGALDTNAGTYDGRVDQLDTGTTDNGTAIAPRGYTGVVVADQPLQRQILRIRGLVRKAASGLWVGISRTPEKSETDSEWDDVDIPSSTDRKFGRFCEMVVKSARGNREAEQYRICDDGSGECPEVTAVTLDTEVQEDVGASR